MGYATKKQLDYAKQIAETLGMALPEARDFDTISKFIADNRTSFYKVKDEQTRDMIISNIKITDMASELGYTLVRRGSRYFSLQEHDSVIIDTQRNCYWQNSTRGNGNGRAQGGSVIDFVKNFSNMSAGEVMKDLEERVKGITPLEHAQTKMQMEKYEKQLAQQKAQGLQLPEASYNMRRVYAYLTKTRMLDSELVQEFIDRKMLYQDTYGNCVFVSRDSDGKPVFGCKRGTNTEKRFVADVRGCNYDKGFYIDNGADKLVITESVIDAMSVMDIIDGHGLDHNDYNYFPLAGICKDKPVLNCLKDHPVEKVYLAMDSDEPGLEAAQQLKESIENENPDMKEKIVYSLPFWQKDWNDELKYSFSHQMSYSELDVLNEEGLTIDDFHERNAIWKRSAERKQKELEEQKAQREQREQRKNEVSMSADYDDLMEEG